MSAVEWWQHRFDTPPARQVMITFDDAYGDLMEHALPTLLRLGFQATVFAVAGLLGATNLWDEPTASRGIRLMSAADLRAWVGSGMEVGAHGMSHARLTHLDIAKVQRELSDARVMLVAVTDSAVTSFAYPYGANNEGVRNAVASEYSLGFGVTDGLNGPAVDGWALRRTMVRPRGGAADVLCQATLGWSPVTRLHRALRPRARLHLPSHRSC